MEASNAWGSLFALGTQVNIISDLFRIISFFLDSIIYSLIPMVFGIIYGLYDITTVFGADGVNKINSIIETMSKTVYSFLAILMFFKTAFSLLTMLVNPSLIDDKEKGASKIVSSIIITLGLIVLVPVAFNYSRLIQKKVIENKLIEKMITGDKYDDNSSYSLGNELSLSTWSMFLSPLFDNSDFCPGCNITLQAYNNVFKNPSNTTAWPLVPLAPLINSVTGIPIVADIISRLPGLNSIMEVSYGEGSHYQLSYIYFVSTIVGGYLLWAIVKMCIDIAYRSIKFFVLELLSPIAIISNIDPNSSKKGLFSKWLKETLKTYLSLFVRLFVFALASLILREFSGAGLNGNFIVKLFYLLAIIAFIKMAPKFLDNLFGTELSKDGDTKFASDLLRGGLGAAAGAAIGGIGNAIVAGKKNMPVKRSAWEGIKKGATSGYTSAKKGDMLGYGKSLYAGAIGDAGRSYYGQSSYADSRKQENRLKWAKSNAMKVAAASEMHSHLKKEPQGESAVYEDMMNMYQNGDDRQKSIAAKNLVAMGYAKKNADGSLAIDSPILGTNGKIDWAKTVATAKSKSVLKTDAQRSKVRSLYGKAMSATELFSANSDVGKQLQDNAMHSFTAYCEQATADLATSTSTDFDRQFELSIKTKSLDTLVSNLRSEAGKSYVGDDLKIKLNNAITIANDSSISFEDKVKRLQTQINDIETDYSTISRNASGQSDYYKGKAEDASKALAAMSKDPKTARDAAVLDLAKEGNAYLDNKDIINEADRLNKNKNNS